MNTKIKKIEEKYIIDIHPAAKRIRKQKQLAHNNSLMEIKKIAKRVKALRIERGYLTMESFTKAHGLSRSLYGRFENGNDLKFSSLIKIVMAFEMTFEEFFVNDDM